MRDLAEHLGSVHRWAGHMVRNLSPERVPSRTLDLGMPADDAGIPTWLVAGNEALLDTFRAADPDAAMWAWGADQHARFWPRRMLHETTVHRADAELAGGRDPAIDATVAVDGIDELLDNLPSATYFAPNVAELKGDGDSIALVADEAAWTIHLVADGFTWSHDAVADPSARVSGDAGDLLLLLYSRRDLDDRRITIDGDADLLARWLTNSAL